MSNVQWIMVDDTDPRISYSGAWSTQGQSSLKDMGQFGAPFLLTSHGATANSSFSFSFSGSQLVVAGSQLVPVDLNSFGGTCTVDGVSQPILYTTSNATNRVALCRFQNLSEGRHTLVLDAVPAGHKPFWFDYLRYLPTPDVSTVNEFMLVLTDNDNIFFDSSWNADAPENVIQVSTNTTNAVMSYTFVGTSISWFGSYNHSSSLRPANLSYTIDQSDPVIVPILPSTKAHDNITMEQLIFNASGLSPGITHDLKVTYLGDAESVPLSLNNLVLTWGPLLGFGHNSSAAIPTISGFSLPPLSTNTSVSPSSGAHNTSHVVPIAVGTSVAGAAIVLGALALFIITRQRRQRTFRHKEMGITQDLWARPFTALYSPDTGPLGTNHASHLSRRNSAPAAFVPTSSKARRTQHALLSQVSSTGLSGTTRTGAVAGPSPSSNTQTPMSPVDREAATYIWNLLLRHQRTVSMPVQPHTEAPAVTNYDGEDTDSVRPPAYGM